MPSVTESLPRKSSDQLCPGPGWSSQQSGVEAMVRLRLWEGGNSSRLVCWLSSHCTSTVSPVALSASPYWRPKSIPCDLAFKASSYLSNLISAHTWRKWTVHGQGEPVGSSRASCKVGNLCRGLLGLLNWVSSTKANCFGDVLWASGQQALCYLSSRRGSGVILSQD